MTANYSSSSMLLLGNDIVDLALKGTFDKENDPRFLERVFHSKELKFFSLATEPKVFLWSLWAAKETAYKIGKKINPQLIYSPRNFVVEGRPLLEQWPAEKIVSRVAWEGQQATIQWEFGSEWVHCLGLEGSSEARLKDIQLSVETEQACLNEEFSPQEKASIHSEASAQVRYLAKQMLRRLGLSDVEIIRERQGNRYGPPLVFLGGKRYLEYELSLSHHGRFLAAAVLPN